MCLTNIFDSAPLFLPVFGPYVFDIHIDSAMVYALLDGDGAAVTYCVTH